MRYRTLGATGLRVSELGLGTMTFMAGLSWGTSREECGRIFDAYAAAGGNFVDTSNSYGTGEAYLGELLRADRDAFVVATKYTGSEPGRPVNESGNHRKSLVRSVEGSLSRLGTDHLDLLWLNAWDHLTPAGEIMRALDDLVRAGKVLYVGASNCPAWFVAYANTLADARGQTPFTAIQVRYNLLDRDSDRELLPMARVLDVGVTAWTPLAGGWLTGKYPGEGGRLDGPAGGFVRRDERAHAIGDETTRVAGELGCAPAQVALAWLRRRGVVPFFGARTAGQAAENVRTVELTDEQDRRLDEVSRIPLGYPYDFLSSGMVKGHIHGGWFDRIDDPRGFTELLRKSPTRKAAHG